MMFKITWLVGLLSLSLVLPYSASAAQPVVQAGKWKNFRASTPYAQLVIEHDDLSGDNRQVVFDHEYNGDAVLGRSQIGLITRWSAKSVAAYFYSFRNACSGAAACGVVNDAAQPDTMLIKVGEKILTLNGQQGLFTLTPADAAFLANVAPSKPLVRVSTGGEQFDTYINMGTVNLWKTLYTEPIPASTVPSAVSVPR